MVSCLVEMENDVDDPGEENAITEPTARTGSAVTICGRRMYLWGGHTQIIEGTFVVIPTSRDVVGARLRACTFPT